MKTAPKILTKLYIVISIALYSFTTQAAQTTSSYALTPSSVTILDENATTHQTPASTQKILSSQLAINKWDITHQFQTNFYLHNNHLWVKGKGDPFFVSEEMDSFIVDFLQQYPEISTLKGIGIDGSYFADTRVQGRDGKNDPYNAPLSAIATNFNTVFIKKRGKQITSAEPQTPLTPTARRLAGGLSDGKHRINLIDRATSETYFAELLRAKLIEVGIDVGDSIKRTPVPADAALLLTHKNSRQLSDVLRGALEYSNNFISNMLFIQLCDREDGHSMLDAPQCAEDQLASTYPDIFSLKQGKDWKIADGAGLSRKNRLSAKQMVDMLAVFAPHKHLLKKYHQGRAHAKTGTLHGIRTFAGYVTTDCGDVRFAFFFEGKGVYGKRERALERLIKKIDTKSNNICN